MNSAKKSKKSFQGDLLRKFNLFDQFSDDILKQMANESNILELDSNYVIFSEDSEIKSMFFILEGQVQVSKKEVSLAQLNDGEYFGEMSILKDETRSATVKTMVPSILIEISENLFNKFIKNSPGAMHDILMTYDKRLRKENLRVINQFIELKEKYAELQETHRQLLQTEKLASIGMITAGVAHEINNPLTVISGYIEILQDELNQNNIDQAELNKSLDAMEKASSAIEKIVIGLKTYVRADDGHNVPIKLNDTVQASIDLVSFLYRKESITIETFFTDKNPMILANTGKFQQIIINLLSNAKDAMEKSEDKIISIITEVENNYITIKVKDTGCGIPEEKLDTIFEKFYTTKPIGKGTGLGLDIIRNIIENMNATINVESSLGNGTTFTITIPVANS